MVDKIKNPETYVTHKIENWLKEHGYSCRRCYVVNNVYAFTSKRLSKESIEEFKEDFGNEIFLKKASFDENRQCQELVYCCSHPLLDEFRYYLKSWLNDHNFPLHYFTITHTISLYTHEKLTQTQIDEFEEEFEAVFHSYSKECHSKQFEYTFKTNLLY